MVDALLRQNPEGLSIEERANLGCLPDRLSLADVIAVAFPLSAPDGNALRVRLARNRFGGILKDAMSSGALKFEKEPDRKEVRHAPAQGWGVSSRGRNSSIWDDSGGIRELWERTAPRTVNIPGTVWLRRDAVAAWLNEANAWPPNHGDGLRRWWPELDAAQAAQGRKNARAGAAGMQSKAEAKAERERLLKPYVEKGIEAYMTRNNCKGNYSASARCVIGQDEDSAKRDKITESALRKAIAAAWAEMKNAGQ
ncbi:MAG: hypothetical protein QM661_14750 [Solimonas sp.]